MTLEVADGTDRRAPCETGAWQHRRRGTLTARNRWWHRRNRWLDINRTGVPSHGHRFRQPATTCCRLEMPSQSLLQLRAVILHPTPNRGVVDVETTLLQQLLNIAQRERIARIPSDRTKDETGFGLPPFEDRRSAYHFAIVSPHQPATPKVASHPFGLPSGIVLASPFFQRYSFAASGSVRRLRVGVSFVISGFMSSAYAE